MNNFVYFLLEVMKNGVVNIHHISIKWRSDITDVARDLSGINESTIYVTQLFLLRPFTSKKLFIFKEGKLISYVKG